jgi:hypothetical protein
LGMGKILKWTSPTTFPQLKLSICSFKIMNLIISYENVLIESKQNSSVCEGLRISNWILQSRILNNVLQHTVHTGCPVRGMKCLRSLEHCDSEFESHSRHGCLCLFCVCVR